MENVIGTGVIIRLSQNIQADSGYVIICLSSRTQNNNTELTFSE